MGGQQTARSRHAAREYQQWTQQLEDNRQPKDNIQPKDNGQLQENNRKLKGK
jgi:hypothetical protein